ncbi:MAG: response regulator, partial [Deltaproteobacteria bacterium]|nr:response regulator [Deltaproteobacteria bacterium]
SLRPDVVLVDGMLPGIDGVTVIRRLKSDAALRNVPTLLLTAADDEGEELRSLEAGADAYAKKSDNFEVILVRLTALLRTAVGKSEVELPRSLLAPKRLLAVDDSVTYLQELGQQLRSEGYDVVLAHSGEEALELLEVQAVDCILLDLVMPGLSGEETCRRIKLSTRFRDVPLVLLTAREDQSAMIDGINAGADDYIPKSADFEVLKARLRAQLRRKHFEDENRRIREQLVRKETDARFQRLIHSNIIGVVLGDLSGQLTEANGAFVQMTGWSRAELTSGTLSFDAITPPEWHARDGGALSELRARKDPQPYEKEILRKDGARLPILQGLVRIEDTDKIIGFALDRTEQKRSEEALRASKLALEASNAELALAKERAERESQFKSKFLASMSHELRTPLNAVLGFSELLEQQIVGPLVGKQKAYVNHIHSSGKHLLNLVNDILDLSKIEAGRMELSRTRAGLDKQVEAVLAIVAPLAEKKKLRIEVLLAPGLPELFIDPVRVKQVLYNLLSNAIKFSPQGSVIELSAERVDELVSVACKDAGVGIKPEDLPRLFREFEQLENAPEQQHQGTGLGLALTRRLVELHGGTISVTSTVGRGSTFTFTLPLPGATP